MSLPAKSAITPVSMSLYDTDFDQFSKALGQSFERFGFAVVADHGLSADLITDMLAKAKALFDLPTETKTAWKVQNGGGARGYTPFGIETAKGATHHDLKEFWHVGRELPQGHKYQSFMPANIWPEQPEGFKATIYGLYEAFDGLGGRLLKAIAHHLAIGDDYFSDKVDAGNSVLRLLHYPPVGEEGPHVRAGAHEDINVITLLLGAEEAGLELLDKDGQWLPITPPEGAIVINIGDMLQRLTNHRLPSTTHRVVNPAVERRGYSRYSTPFFLHFNPDFVIETLPSCVTEQAPNRYQTPITADDYLQERLREIKLA